MNETEKMSWQTENFSGKNWDFENDWFSFVGKIIKHESTTHSIVSLCTINDHAFVNYGCSLNAS